MARIIFGICGISYWHLNRQKAIVQELLQNGHHLQIFTFGSGIGYCAQHFPGVTVRQVLAPWIACDKRWVDFLESAMHPANRNRDAFGANFSVMHAATKEFGGGLDLVISDYEPISAQYAYATGTPLITSDQQSKFTFLPYEEIDWFSSLEEKWRLDLFFPKAERRLVCSFFKLWTRSPKFLRVVPPIIKSEIRKIRRLRKGIEPHLILLYQSSMMSFEQQPDDICEIISGITDQEFVVYSPRYRDFQDSVQKRGISNLRAYPIGNPTFEEHLIHAKWAISTAGHSFISELMYLGIPVYATPLPIFEQLKTAKVISESSFWVSSPRICEKLLSHFIVELDTFSKNIRDDTSILLRGNWTQIIMRIINQFLNESHASKN